MAALQPHQQRVFEEHLELTERIGKLSAFFRTATFGELPLIEQELLRDQLPHMCAYQRVLAMRLSHWGAQS
jgi:hypothetical protein